MAVAVLLILSTDTILSTEQDTETTMFVQYDEMRCRNGSSLQDIVELEVVIFERRQPVPSCRGFSVDYAVQFSSRRAGPSSV